MRRPKRLKSTLTVRSRRCPPTAEPDSAAYVSPMLTMYGDCPCSARSFGTTGRSDPPSPGMYTRMTSGTLTEDRTSVKLVLSEIPRSAGEMPSRPDRSSNSTPQLSALPPFTQVLSSSVDGRTATSMGLSKVL